MAKTLRRTGEDRRRKAFGAFCQRNLSRDRKSIRCPFATVSDNHKKFRFKTVAPYRHELEVLYEDASNVLKTLSGKYELGIIANQTDGLCERLDSFGILQYFTHVITSWEIQIMKPNRRIFEFALKTAESLPHEAVMIGDRIDNDIEPAKAVGMKTVWIKQGFGRLQIPLSEKDTPDYSIDNLSELLHIF